MKSHQRIELIKGPKGDDSHLALLQNTQIPRLGYLGNSGIFEELERSFVYFWDGRLY